MKRAAYILLAFALLCLATGCRTIRTHSSTDINAVSNDTYDHRHGEQLISELVDSLIRVKAPQEKSANRGVQHSELDTSLASSTAGIDSTGMLYHTIENKDSILSRIIYKTKTHTIRDTVRIEHRDMVRITQNSVTEKGLTFLQKAQMRGFWVLLIAALAVVAIWGIKTVIKRYL